MREAAPTPLGQWIAAWLTHQRSLGRGYDGEQRVLAHLQRYVAMPSAADLDQAGFDRWCASLANLSATTRRGRRWPSLEVLPLPPTNRTGLLRAGSALLRSAVPLPAPRDHRAVAVEQMLTVADAGKPTRRYCREPCTWPSSFSTPPGCVAASWPVGPRRYRASDWGSAHSDVEVPNPDWCRYLRRQRRTACLPAATPRGTIRHRSKRVAVLRAPGIAGTVLAWVRPSTACWSPPTCWTEGRRPRVRYEAQLRGPGSDALVSRRRRRPVQPATPGDLHGACLDRTDCPLPALHTGDAPTCKRPLSASPSAMSSRRCRHEDVSTVRPWPIDRCFFQEHILTLRRHEPPYDPKLSRRPGPVPAVRCHRLRTGDRIFWRCRHHCRSGRPLPCLWKPPAGTASPPAMRGSPLCIPCALPRRWKPRPHGGFPAGPRNSIQERSPRGPHRISRKRPRSRSRGRASIGSTPSGQRDYAMFSLIFTTGARVQEILNLQYAMSGSSHPSRSALPAKATKMRICPIWPRMDGTTVEGADPEVQHAVSKVRPTSLSSMSAVPQ